MLGCCRLAAASASRKKRCDLFRPGQGAGPDHFQSHVPFQIRLPGLPDDAHAAAGDLLEEFVIAKILEPRPGLGADDGGRGVESRSPKIRPPIALEEPP